jgi:hypothetical protein
MLLEATFRSATPLSYDLLPDFRTSNAGLPKGITLPDQMEIPWPIAVLVASDVMI